MKLTFRQKKVLRAIKSATEERGSNLPPSIREVMRAGNYRSPSSVAQVLPELEKKGLILYKPSKARSIQLITQVVVRSYYNGIQFDDFFATKEEAEQFIELSDHTNFEIIYR